MLFILHLLASTFLCFGLSPYSEIRISFKRLQDLLHLWRSFSFPFCTSDHPVGKCPTDVCVRIIQLLLRVQVDNGCDIDLQMLLKETACHTISPRGFEECPERSLGERVSPHHHPLMLLTCCTGETVKSDVSSLQAVVANCSVLITVKHNNASVTKYNCMTRQGQLVFCFLTPVYKDAFAIQAFV